MNNKKSLRDLIRTKRKSYPEAAQLAASKSLCERLSKEPNVSKAKNIAIYLANDGELNPHLFIQWCWQQHKNIYLPVIHPFSPGHLLFIHYTPDTPLVPNKYGILEPQLNVQSLITLAELDIIYTPLVAFDLSGQRVGMGGGFYDRTLQKWHDEKKSQARTLNFTPIGLAHDFQKVDNISHELWDIPLPEIITPTQKITCKLSKNNII